MKKIIYDYPFIQIDNNKPEKSPIIFVHGFNSQPSRHQIFSNVWKDNDYYAIAFPGNSGVKAIKNHKLNVYQYAELLNQFIEENNLKNVIAIGHSMGGGIISLAYEQKPHLYSKMIYIAPMNKTSLVLKEEFFNTFFPKNFDEYKKFLDLLFYDATLLFNDKEFMLSEEKKFKAEDYNNKDTVEVGRSLPNIDLMNQIEKGLNSIKVPTLLILGENDGIISKEKCVEYFKEQVKDIQINIVPKTGHLIFDENFEEYYKIVEKFIRQ